MKLFIIPGILWGYILSVVLAIPLWGAMYNKLLATFDLSPSQGWILPICINLIVACIGIPQIAKFIASLRRGDTMPVSRRIASSLSIAAVVLSFVASAQGVARTRGHLATAVSELKGGPETDVFAVGEIVDGAYSNHLVGVVMKLPKDWYPMTLNSIRRAKHSGAYAVVGGDKERAEELARARSGIYPLLAVRRYPVDYAGYNPSLVLSAYDKQAVAATGIGTLEAYAISFTAEREPYHVRSGPDRKSVV